MKLYQYCIKRYTRETGRKMYQASDYIQAAMYYGFTRREAIKYYATNRTQNRPFEQFAASYLKNIPNGAK